MTFSSFAFIPLFAFQAFAIGFQHGVFRSQSTQGPTWIGQATIVAENYRIQVNRNYLDVELTLEFGVGGTAPGEFGNALEIVGNLNLEKNSTVVGMLVWYKDRILKAKLKTKDFARRQYEEVVERNSEVPPPPRDPVLLEWIRQDNYDISIFPVEWGGTRKLRLRYLVPADGAQMGYPHAFSSTAKVSVELGEGVKSFDLVANDGTNEMIQENMELSASKYDFLAYSYGVKKSLSAIRPHVIDTSLRTQIFLGGFHQSHFAGTMAQIFYRAPTELLKDSVEFQSNDYQIFATIRSTTDSCQKPIRAFDMEGHALDVLRLYSREPLKPSIEWSLFRGDTLIRQVEETPTFVRAEDGQQFARSFGIVPFYPMSSTMPASLGISLGFLDSKYTLVALEEDTLGAALEDQYAKQGVPTLFSEDLFPADDEVYEIPVDQWLEQRDLKKEILLASIGSYYPGAITSVTHQWPKSLRFFVQNGILHIRLNSDAQNPDHMQLAVLDLKGKVLKEWVKRDLASQEVTWSPAESVKSSGAFILRVQWSGKVFSKTFLIP